MISRSLDWKEAYAEDGGWTVLAASTVVGTYEIFVAAESAGRDMRFALHLPGPERSHHPTLEAAEAAAQDRHDRLVSELVAPGLAEGTGAGRDRLVADVARALIRAGGNRIDTSDDNWPAEVERYRTMVAAHPGYAEGDSWILTPMRQAGIAVDAIFAMPKGRA